MERRAVAAAASWHGAAAAGQALRQLPPGFRFHPTDEELVVQYLRRKALSRPLPAAVIPVVHGAANLDPWNIPGACEGEAYFFSLQAPPASSRKGGGRRRRAGSGYWKATGKEKPVFLSGSGCGGGGKQQQLVGGKMALAFHRVKPPSRTDWVMHEYRLAAVHGAVAEKKKSANHNCVAQPGEWVVCRITLKNRARRTTGEVESQTPGNGGAPVVHRSVPHREDADLQQQQPCFSSSSSSSPSCVTDTSDQEGVSSP